MKSAGKKVLLWSVAGAAVVTVISWLVLGVNSPLNHGVPPDVHDKPLILFWVIPNLPAGIVCVNIFGTHGPEWTYFLCIFVQWFLIAAFFVGCGIWIRRYN